ncbi:BRO-C [Rachiplusia nu nucleopolyhedrovirus]|uniref:BRO-C n=1 Tax=Rachiplusia nu nucleopolyhedrovirus TaxID=2605775 RepID=A0AAE6IQU7_9ABAC|nr:BRO-C [Rachiplusia nu nucleopolyhedrovirus]QEI03690.1 BRO-C [Rachiplusia nu nucleopolyhedrovirus]
MDSSRKSLLEKEIAIDDLTDNLTLTLKTLTETCKTFTSFGEAMTKATHEAHVSLKTINEAHRDVAKLANRIVDITQEIIEKPSDSQLIYSLAMHLLCTDKNSLIAQHQKMTKPL